MGRQEVMTNMKKEEKLHEEEGDRHLGEKWIRVVANGRVGGHTPYKDRLSSCAK